LELFEYLYRQSHLLRIYERSAIAELRYFVLTNSVQLSSFPLFDIAKSSQINACKGINLKLLNGLLHIACQSVSPNPLQGRAGFAIISITGVSHAYTGPIRSGNPVQ